MHPGFPAPRTLQLMLHDQHACQPYRNLWPGTWCELPSVFAELYFLLNEHRALYTESDESRPFLHRSIVCSMVALAKY